MSHDVDKYSEVLKNFLTSHGIWHRFIEFDEPVKTVERASRKVAVDQIAKSIILIDSNNTPLMVILRARAGSATVRSKHSSGSRMSGWPMKRRS